MFNQWQREYMRELSELSADQKCACGWYRKGQCPNCRRIFNTPHKFTPTNGNVYRCSVCGQPNYDCTGERPEAEGLIKRNPQATAEEDQL